MIVALSVALATAFFAGCGSNDDTSSGSVKAITVGQYTLGNPYGLAIENGWFKDEFGDIEVKFVNLESTANALAGLASGDLDVALIGTPGAATALSQGLDMKVAWIFDVVDKAEALVVNAKHHVTGPQDLKGLTIAATGGSTGHYALLQYMKINGLTDKDVKIVDLSVADQIAAFKRGEIDGSWTSEPFITQLVESGGERIATTGDMLKDGVVVADVAAVNGKFAREHGDLLKRYIKVLDRATQAYLDDTDGVMPTMSKYLGLPADQVKTIMAGYRFLTAKEQADSQYLGGGLATSIHDNAVVWKDLDRVPSAASEDTIKSSVVTDYLESWTGK